MPPNFNLGNGAVLRKLRLRATDAICTEEQFKGSGLLFDVG
jgi:hypothetical protein